MSHLLLSRAYPLSIFMHREAGRVPGDGSPDTRAGHLSRVHLSHLCVSGGHPVLLTHGCQKAPAVCPAVPGWTVPGRKSRLCGAQAPPCGPASGRRGAR